MGTSVSQPSPPSLPWRAVFAAYADERIPLARAVNELFRAATADPQVDLVGELSSGTVYAFYRIACSGVAPQEAMELASRIVTKTKTSSIIVQLAKRALVGTCVGGGGSIAFCENLFAQIGDYYVSRDVSGRIGIGQRNKSVREVMEFREEVTAAVREAARASAPARPPTLTEWRHYVRRTLEVLKGWGS